MKKKALTVILVLIVVAGYEARISQEKQTFDMSDLTMSNVEALANGEGGPYSCAEYLDSYVVEYYYDGSYRAIGTYKCGSGLGQCKTGLAYIYYNQYETVIGLDDQRVTVTCV